MKVNHSTFKTQGDVVLIPVKELPKGLKKVKGKDKILQDSETQGKYHRFHPEAKVEIYETPGQSDGDAVTLDHGKFIVVSDDSVLFHGKGFNPEPSTKTLTDHAGITVTPGVYKIGIQRVYNYEKKEAQKVID